MKAIVFAIGLITLIVGLTFSIFEYQQGQQPIPQGGPLFRTASSDAQSVPTTSNVLAVLPPQPNQDRDRSELDVAIDTNATFLITDAAQRRTGRDSQTGGQLQDIPNSTYFEDRLNNDVTGQAGQQVSHQAEILQPAPGTYEISITGVHDGPYDLSVRTFSRDGSAQPALDEQGAIKAGSMITFVLTFTSEPGQDSTLVELP